MTLTRPLRLLACVLCVVALPASNALAGKRSASPPPSVSSLSPLALRVGDTLTIRGHRFLPGAKRNSVSFKRDGMAPVVVKAGAATRTRLKVVVPAKLAKYFTAAAGGVRASRFRVRVGSGHSTKGYTSLKRSPLIGLAPGAAVGGPGQLDGTDDGCDTAGVVDGIEGDDGTLAVDAPAAAAVTDPCSLVGDDPSPADDGG
jgi:IPT/TIG domain-containing protein